MKNKIFIILIFLSVNIFSQNFGLKIGATSVTPTGNNDDFDFDFLQSLSPGYQIGFVGNFELSDVIILKPEFTYRLYTLKQEVLWYTNTYQIEQSHTTVSADLNFDIELTNSVSLIFGMGVDYIMSIDLATYINDFEETISLDLTAMSTDQLIDPFANISICFKPGRRFLFNIEYRHLLDNWGMGSLIPGSQLINSNNGSVKLHMLNFTTTVLF